ncbi:MAG: hypothetical protein HKN04_15400 [Rhodothermaceae bacterium]|nr:hypothetical protein [Rhodothermaceae bacterium]
MRSFLLALLLVLGIGCNNPDLAENLQLPEFTALDGPPSSTTDYHPKQTTATADVHGWVNSEVFLRYALNDDSLLTTTSATDVTDLCEESGSVRTCTFDFPLGGNPTPVVFDVGDRVFYQWFVEYALPEGTDPAYTESEVRSFVIELPASCSDDDDCPGTERCVRDERRADPTDEGGTLAPLVCIP